MCINTFVITLYLIILYDISVHLEICINMDVESDFLYFLLGIRCGIMWLYVRTFIQYISHRLSCYPSLSLSLSLSNQKVTDNIIPSSPTQ